MTISMRKPLVLATAVAVAFTAPPSYAEDGDYWWWETIGNLFWPPAADNMVTPAQRTGDYPLLSNPAGFPDNFNKGGYFGWQTVQLSPSTGATCGNGTPYKFFVNRTPNTRNTIIYMEGGGACWDYASCSGQNGIRGARNPNGIPNDYMSLLNPGASLVSPFVTRINPFTWVKTQGWNMVYVPYCTGDVYGGDRVAVYGDPTGKNPPLVWHHNGTRNVRAVTSWLKDNLPRPTQMLSTGCSAGGTGSMINYAPLRRDMAPNRGYMINDSGPIFDAPVWSNADYYPQLPLQNKIRDSWGLNTWNGPLANLAKEMPYFSTHQLGSIYDGLALRFPNDRLGHTHFSQDLEYSAYSYERFFPDIQNAPNAQIRDARILSRWGQDTQRLAWKLNWYGNFGGYFPQYRNLNHSHCTTIVDFANGDIQPMGLELGNFIDSVMNGSGNVLDAYETSDVADRNKPQSFLYWLLGLLLGI